MSPTPPQVVEVAPDSVLIVSVRALHRRSKQWLGFLPDAGFTDRAAKGTLLAAVQEDGTVAGYVLYDLPADRIKLVHLCVSASARREGIGRQLVDAVRERHGERRGIQLLCRRDFAAASETWRRLGFLPRGTRAGRKKEGSELTVWLLAFGNDDLFSIQPQTIDAAALDQNVFEDLVVGPHDRPQGRASQALAADWIGEHVELTITGEVFLESDKCPDPELRQKLHASATAFRNLCEKSAPFAHLLPAVRSAAPKADEGDHCHVARAAAGGATYFVTRDDDLLDGAKELREHLHIDVVRPEELVVQLDESRRGDRYQPVSLSGTEYDDSRLAKGQQEQFVQAILATGAAEQGHRLRTIVRDALSDHDHCDVRAVRDTAGKIIAGVVRRFDHERLEVLVLRVTLTGRRGDALARQLVGAQRQFAALHGLRLIHVVDPHIGNAVQRSLADEFFDFADEEWVATVETGVIHGSGASIDAAVQIELERWPLKVLGAGIQTFMLPIRPAYAGALFDWRLTEETLFKRDTNLGIAREHVYYRSALASAGIRSPCRILWYVSAERHRHAVGSVRAVSHAAEILAGPAKILARRFARLGVWTEREVVQAGGATGRVMAIRFVDTELLEPIKLPALRDLYAEVGEPFAMPYGPRRIPEQVFDLVYQRSSPYAS